MAAVGAVELKIGDGNDAKTVKVDDAWLRKERKRIEDLYTFQIDNFGRVILREDRKDFDAAVNSFLKVVEQYHEKVRAALDDHRASFRDSFVAELVLSDECELVSLYPTQIIRQAAQSPRHSLRAAARRAL